MNKADIEKSFKKYADKLSAKADKRVARLSADAEERTILYFKALEGRFNDKLEVFREEVTSRFEDINGRFEAIDNRFEDVNVRFEEVNDKFDKLTAIVNEISRKLDLTFEKVGEIAVDVEVIKETVKDHGVRIQRIETR